MVDDCSNTACADPLATCSNHSYGIDCGCLPGVTFTYGPTCETCLPLPHITALDNAGDLETSDFLRGWIAALVCFVLFTSMALWSLFYLFRTCYPSVVSDKTKRKHAVPVAGFGWDSFARDQTHCDFAHGNTLLFALGFIVYEATIHGTGLYTNRAFFLTQVSHCRFHSIGIGVGLLLMAGSEARRALRQVLWIRYLKALHHSGGLASSLPSHHDLRYIDKLTLIALWFVVAVRVAAGFFDEEARSCCYRPLAWNWTDVTFLSVAIFFWTGCVVCLALLLTDTIVWYKQGFVSAFMSWSLFGAVPDVTEKGKDKKEFKIRASGCNAAQWIMSIGWSLFLSMWMIAVLIMHMVAYGQLRQNDSYHRLSGVDTLFRGEAALVLYWLWTLATLAQWHIFYTTAVVGSTREQKAPAEKEKKKSKSKKKKEEDEEEEEKEVAESKKTQDALSPLDQLAKRVQVQTLLFTGDLETLFTAARMDNTHFWNQPGGLDQAKELFQSVRDDVQKALVLMAVVPKNK